MSRRLLLALTIVFTGLPASAYADQLLDPAPGGVNLAAGEGYTVWSRPGEDTGWQLTVRAPTGR